MAKIALVFLFAVCILHLSTGARIVRDLEPVPEVKNAMENTLQSISQLIEKALTKENLEKIGENIKQIGEKLAEQGKDLMQQADAGIKKLQS